LNVQGHDFLLDSAERRKPSGPKFRRALAHDQSDGLTFNFGNDYPGGVTISGPLIITISHHEEMLPTGLGHPPDETVKLSDVIKTLRGQIASLQAQIDKLAPRP
jgi:hypothetical protein